MNKLWMLSLIHASKTVRLVAVQHTKAGIEGIQIGQNTRKIP
jgi:hypothetical protein